MKKRDDVYKRMLELSGRGLSKRSAAQMLYKEGFFTLLESARSYIRHHTNAKGAGGSLNVVKWNTDIPIPEKSEFGVRDISEANGILMLCDIHLPFHVPGVIEHALERKSEYDTIILQEVFDFYALSKFDKTRVIKPAREQALFFEFMDWLRDEAPNHRIIFQQGNHDERYWLTFMRKAPEIAEMKGMEFETIFNFAEYDIEPLPPRNLLYYRGLFMGHGHEIGARGAPVSPARTFMLKTKGNFIGGHFHRTSEQVTRDIKDEILGCWSVGCCCELHPLYAPINEWNNGYAIIRPHGEKNFRVKNVKIFD